MKTCKPKTNWLIDAVLFAGFLAAFFLDLTGLAMHQWLGVALVVLAGYHFLVHLGWVEAITRRFFGGTSGQARIYYTINAALMLGFYLILLTGLVISTWMPLPLQNYLAWMNIHIIVSIMTLMLVFLKIAMHWRWIVTVARRNVFAGAVPIQDRLSGRPMAGPASQSRRDFLKLMGFVSAAAVVATGSALNGVSWPSNEETEAETATNARNTDASIGQSTTTSQPALPTATPGNILPATSTPAAQDNTCVVRCPNHCSYPGRCRRYVDANQNNLCDNGECL